LFGQLLEVICLLGDETLANSLQFFTSFGVGTWKLPTFGLILWVLEQTKDGPFGME
jgi:hypothetical protein